MIKDQEDQKRALDAAIEDLEKVEAVKAKSLVRTTGENEKPDYAERCKVCGRPLSLCRCSVK